MSQVTLMPHALSRALHALRIIDSRRATGRRSHTMAMSRSPRLTTPQLWRCSSRLRHFRYFWRLSFSALVRSGCA